MLGPGAVEPMRLGGVAAAVFAALDEPRSEPELLAVLCETGVDGSGVAEALRMLCSADLISFDARDAS